MINLTSYAPQFRTGDFIYSDVQIGPCDEIDELPLMNRLGYVPGLSILSGAMRCIVAIFHALGHTFAALYNQDKHHWPHVIKGFAEMTRGLVEMVPVFGNAFCAWHDRNATEDFTSRRVWIVSVSDYFKF